MDREVHMNINRPNLWILLLNLIREDRTNQLICIRPSIVYEHYIPSFMDFLLNGNMANQS